MVQEMLRPGLEGVVAAETSLSEVDGLGGRLTIAGYDVAELAPSARFEEVAFLLWNGRRPSVREAEELGQRLRGRRDISPLAYSVLESAKAAAPIDALRMAVGLTRVDPLDEENAWNLVGSLPTLVAAHYRLSLGEAPVSPRPDLVHVANYLYMLTGEAPRQEVVRAVETYLNAAVDHGLNASTFVARAIVSTGSDLVSAVVGALGSLKGPLHGGAPGPALETVFEIGTPERAEPILRDKLERGERLMGFGHRVYKVRDPRADVLKGAIERLFASAGDRALFELAMEVEKTALRLLDEYKPGRNIRTNVEFNTALLLQGAGLPASLFTPTFALARVVGWTAHAMEQRRSNRVIRPQSRYVGPRNLVWA